ncbi:MAG: heme exporter protein CcmD [Parvibaculum sp.]
MTDFLHMGGYAAFVWPAYGLTALVILGLIWRSIADYRRQTALAEKLEALSGGRVRPTASSVRDGEVQ